MIMKKLLLTAISAIAILSATGQTIEPTETEEKDLNARVEALEVQNKQIKQKLFSMPKVSGFLNIPYEYTSEEGSGTTSSSIAIKRARLKVTGQIGTKFDYCLQADFASSPKLVDAYVNYNLKPWLSFKAGQSKTIFSLENKVFVPLKLETVESSNASNALAGSSDVSGLSSTGRDIGLTVYGAVLPRDGFSILEYALAVYNGNGINAKDNNKSKDIAAALDINPCKQFKIAASVQFGEYGPQYYHKDRYSIGLKWEDSKLLVRGEYLAGSTGSAAGTFQTQGGYLIASYWVLPGLRPIVRYDVLQRDTRSDLLQTEYLIGLDYWPVKNHLRLQANYTYGDFNSSRYKNIHKFVLMLTAAF